MFAATDPVPLPELANGLEVDPTRLPTMINNLQQRLEGTGLHVVALAGGYSLATRPEYAEHVQRLLEPDPQRLSVPGLETLAIIAYNQPITRPEIDEVRGVNSTGTVNTLLGSGLVRVTGRKDAPGRPFLLETTAHFLSAFGLKDLSELPSLSALQAAMEKRTGVTRIDQSQLPVQHAADTNLDQNNAGQADENLETPGHISDTDDDNQESSQSPQ